MNRLFARMALLALVAFSPAAFGADPPAGAAQANASDAPYTLGSVWDLSFIRVVPGMGDEYL
ncbi:MAG TPA: hypothetical protein VFK90_15740, partial [Anaeromyxobacter sp.]|nr:hypothetical protein [Anaeromyxobacter sp.]